MSEPQPQSPPSQAALPTPVSPNFLMTGDPRRMHKEAAPFDKQNQRRGEPATFSRFVLPLPYRLTRLDPQPTAAPAHYFEEAWTTDWLHSAICEPRTHPGPEDFGALFEASLDRERRDYFTRETSDVMFRRARWLVLRGLGQPPFRLPVQRDGRSVEVTVRLRPPALVLFECPKTPQNCGDVGLLPHAMLVVEAWWEQGTGDTAPRLEDLLVFNELFRYFQRPFERHARLPDDDGNPFHNYRRELADLPVDWRETKVKLGAVIAGEDLRLSCYLRRWEWMLECPIMLPTPSAADAGPQADRQWWSLVPPTWVEAARRWVGGPADASLKSTRDYGAPDTASPSRSPSPTHGWLLYADNRAYVWTCAVLQGDSELLPRVRDLGGDMERPVGVDLGHWLRLVNMDPLGPNPETCSAFEARFANGSFQYYHGYRSLLSG